MSDSLIDVALANNSMARMNSRISQEIANDATQALQREKEKTAKLSKENDDLSLENYKLKSGNALASEVDRLKAECLEKDKTITRQRELLKDWMVSQVAFKNLFKKYGKMPDGRPLSEAPQEEKLKLIEEEKAVALKNDAYLSM